MGAKIVQGNFEASIEDSRALIQTTEEPQLLDYDILVAADGVNSDVRESLNIPFEITASAQGALILMPRDKKFKLFSLSPIYQTGEEYMRIYNFYSWVKAITSILGSKPSVFNLPRLAQEKL